MPPTFLHLGERVRETEAEREAENTQYLCLFSSLGAMEPQALEVWAVVWKEAQYVRCSILQSSFLLPVLPQEVLPLGPRHVAAVFLSSLPHLYTRLRLGPLLGLPLRGPVGLAALPYLEAVPLVFVLQSLLELSQRLAVALLVRLPLRTRA